MGALSVSATVPHEAGHIAVCAAGGHDYRMLLGPMGPVVECSPVPTHLWLYRAMGGAAGAAFLAALFAWPRVRRSAPWRAGLFGAVYLQLAIMVIETWAHSLYMAGPVPTAAVSASALLVAVSMVRPLRKPRAGLPAGGPDPGHGR